MLKVTKKTALLVGLPTAAVLAGGIAFAAAETVTSTSLGGGSGTVSNTCGVAASYLSGTDTEFLNSSSTPAETTAGYYVVGVTVTPSTTTAASACSSKDWRLELTGTGGGSPTTEASGTFGSPPAAPDD